MAGRENEMMRIDGDTKELLRQSVPGTNDAERVRNALRQQGPLGVSNRTRQVVISESVGTGKRVRLRENSPVPGAITSLSLKFPDGVQGNVEAAVEVKGNRVLPSSGDFVTLNQDLPVFPFEEEVSKGDDIDLVVENKDPVHSHKITLIANVVQQVEVQ